MRQSNFPRIRRLFRPFAALMEWAPNGPCPSSFLERGLHVDQRDCFNQFGATTSTSATSSTSSSQAPGP
jgi:hypothetical protein